MRILVISDTHGDEYSLRQAIARQPEAQLIFHLGDGAREAQYIADDFPGKLRIVRGNSDFGYSSILSETGIEVASGHRIFYTHGHRYNVKMGYYHIICAARERNAKILLFGHTHTPFCEYEDGLYILNPGSLANCRQTYGIIDITPAGIVPNIVEMHL